MIEVAVARLGLDGQSNSYVVILREKGGGGRLLPIWIGPPEAESILLQMNNVKRERPLTHDLCKSLVLGLGGELRRVNITKVQKGTYFAELHLVRGDTVIQIDARPSDSIAIALRLSAPIFADESLLTEVEDDEGEDGDSDAIIPEATPQLSTEEMTVEQLKQHLENLRPEDFGKFNL